MRMRGGRRAAGIARMPPAGDQRSAASDMPRRKLTTGRRRRAMYAGRRAPSSGQRGMQMRVISRASGTRSERMENLSDRGAAGYRGATDRGWRVAAVVARQTRGGGPRRRRRGGPGADDLRAGSAVAQAGGPPWRWRAGLVVEDLGGGGGINRARMSAAGGRRTTTRGGACFLALSGRKASDRRRGTLGSRESSGGQ